jgi:hypothetical protein
MKVQGLSLFKDKVKDKNRHCNLPIKTKEGKK